MFRISRWLENFPFASHFLLFFWVELIKLHEILGGKVFWEQSLNRVIVKVFIRSKAFIASFYSLLRLTSRMRSVFDSFFPRSDVIKTFSYFSSPELIKLKVAVIKALLSWRFKVSCEMGMNGESWTSESDWNIESKFRALNPERIVNSRGAILNYFVILNDSREVLREITFKVALNGRWLVSSPWYQNWVALTKLFSTKIFPDVKVTVDAR